MTDAESRRQVIGYWLEKARRALESARAEAAAERYDFAVNRAYYACFYAASALLLRDGRAFAKHTAVRATLHRHYVKTGILSVEWGRFFDRVFENRQQCDYQTMVAFEADQVAELVRLADGFVARIAEILKTS